MEIVCSYRESEYAWCDVLLIDSAGIFISILEGAISIKLSKGLMCYLAHSLLATLRRRRISRLHRLLIANADCCDSQSAGMKFASEHDEEKICHARISLQ